MLLGEGFPSTEAEQMSQLEVQVEAYPTSTSGAAEREKDRNAAAFPRGG
jgi:hypothetical protein